MISKEKINSTITIAITKVLGTGHTWQFRTEIMEIGFYYLLGCEDCGFPAETEMPKLFVLDIKTHVNPAGDPYEKKLLHYSQTFKRIELFELSKERSTEQVLYRFLGFKMTKVAQSILKMQINLGKGQPTLKVGDRVKIKSSASKLMHPQYLYANQMGTVRKIDRWVNVAPDEPLSGQDHTHGIPYDYPDLEAMSSKNRM
jgi:hypothetical protein